MRATPALTDIIRTPEVFDTVSTRDALLPVSALKAWIASGKQEEDARAILAPYKVSGTVLVSDAGGLSKLSAEYDLIDILRIIHEPKRSIFALCSSIGGTAVGSWVADNTTMFFDSSVSPKDIIALLGSLQSALSQHTVQTGIGIHTGEFYRIGNKIFGPALDYIDHIAENEVVAGQVWISGDTMQYLGVDGLHPVDQEGFYRWPESNVMIKTHDQSEYPHAFSKEFYTLLDLYADTGDVSVKSLMLDRFSRYTTVVFLKHHISMEASLSSYMDKVLISLLWKDALEDIAGNLGLEFIKTEGMIGILLVDDPRDLTEALVSLRHQLTARGFYVSIGVDKGTILVFDKGEEKDVAGEAVNIASKLSEDLGEKGSCYITTDEYLPDTRQLFCSGVHIPVISL